VISVHSGLFRNRSAFDRCEADGSLATEFCGVSGNCYAKNCDNFYKYGPEAYTGVEKEHDRGYTDLECKIGDEAFEDPRKAPCYRDGGIQ